MKKYVCYDGERWEVLGKADSHHDFDGSKYYELRRKGSPMLLRPISECTPWPMKSLLELMRKNQRKVKPVKVIVIDTFRCGHARAYNTWVDANGQSRCVACKRKKR